MFDLSWLLIIVLAVLLLGPEELPTAIKALGKMWAKLRNFSQIIQIELDKTINDNEKKGSYSDQSNVAWIDLPRQRSPQKWD